MRELLSVQSVRQLELLEYLLKSGEVTLAEVSNATGYASRTLWQDIKEINEFLKPMEIETTSKGVELIIPAAYSVRAVYRRVLCQSREYNLLEYLLFNEGQSLEELADNLYISLSTLRRMITTMNEKLAKFDIKIAVAPARVIGDEPRVSQFYVALFTEKYYELADFLKKGEFQTLNLLLQKITKEGKMNLSFSDLQKLRILGYVRIVRLRYGHEIPLDETDMKLLHNYKFLKEPVFLTQFMATFNMQMNEHVLLQMYQVLYGKEYFYSYQHLEEVITEDKHKKKVFAAIGELIESLGEEFSISTENTERLQISLYNMLRLSEYRYFIIYSRSRQFIEGFDLDNPNVLNIFEEKMAILERHGLELPNHIYDDVIYTLMTEWPDFLEKLESFVPDIKIGLLFDTDRDHVEFIHTILRKYSKQRLTIVVPNLSSTMMGQLREKDIDLLITDIPHLAIRGVEIICVEEYPSKRDWKNILEAQERIVSRKMLLATGEKMRNK